jgi:hypothetical protein
VTGQPRRAQEGGPVEQATRERLGALRGADGALVALAYRLAQLMDEEPTAAVAKELRATIQAVLADAGQAGRGKADRLASVVGRIGSAS